MSGRKGVNPGLAVHDVNLWHRYTRSDRHFFYDVQQLALIGVRRVRVNQAPVQQFGDCAAATSQLQGFEDAPD